jgi:hypothetical protein
MVESVFAGKDGVCAEEEVARKHIDTNLTPIIMKTMNDLIRKRSKKYRDAFAGVEEQGAKEYSCEIDCANLRDFVKENITESSEYKEIFDALKEMTGPCVYYFEILAGPSQDDIIERFNVCKENKPALKKNPKDRNNSKILYVGKVEGFNPEISAIAGRLIMHLGFHTNKNGGSPERSKVHGLYLFDWAKEIKLKLKFHVFEFEFEEDTKGLVGIIEKDLANELKPLIGKHR